MRYWTLLVLLAMPSLASAQQYYHYYPSSPVQFPYEPPINYGPGNHFPHPFEGYPGHPVSHLYYPYTYAPYSFYYSYPTFTTYKDSYNPYYRCPWMINTPLVWPQKNGAPAGSPSGETPKKSDGPPEKKEPDKK